MPFIKHTKEKLEQMELARNKMVSKLEILKVISEGDKTDFWKRIKRIVLDKLDSIESQLEDYEKLTEIQRIGLLEARKNFRFFSRIPQDFNGGLAYLNREISEMNSKINEYKRKLDR